MWISGLEWTFSQTSSFLISNPVVVSFLSIPVSVVIFLSKQALDNKKSKRDLKDKIYRFCVAMEGDIQEIIKTLQNRKFKKMVDKNKELEYTHLILFTNIYKSFLYTGLLTYLDSQLQIDLDNVYAKIEFRNSLLRERVSAFTNMVMNQNDKLKEIHDEYEELITQNENELKVELPLVKEKLVQEEKRFQC